MTKSNLDLLTKSLNIYWLTKFYKVAKSMQKYILKNKPSYYKNLYFTAYFSTPLI